MPIRIPKKHQEVATVEKDGHFWKYKAERNDTLLNGYIPPFTMGWMANTDLSPCTNAASVVHYIAKLASKAEKKSQNYTELFKKATQGLNRASTTPLMSSANRLLNALVGERDWTAQEVMHHLLGQRVVERSRAVESLCMRPLGQLSMSVEAQDGGLIPKGKGWMQKYMDRQGYVDPTSKTTLVAGIDAVTLWDFVRLWRISKNTAQKRPRAKPHVVSLYPRYSWKPTHNTYEDFCRAKMMLHHPWVTKEDVAAMRTSPADDLHDGEEDAAAASEYDDESDRDGGEQPDFATLAARHCRHDGADMEEIETKLGKRKIDRAYDWHQSDHRYDEYGDQSTFYTVAKTLEPPHEYTLHDPDTLQGAQRICFDVIMRQYERQHDFGELPYPLLLHIDGVAGTGKSYLIDTISAHLYEAAHRQNYDECSGCPDPEWYLNCFDWQYSTEPWAFYDYWGWVSQEQVRIVDFKLFPLLLALETALAESTKSRDLCSEKSQKSSRCS
ncbi:MAG: hypothetical protein MMC33_010790 [Icmadophila ericetorum]|nr:hypothetical protein [Icmadophila ericetorum]